MAKRFTATDIWDEDWFLEMPMEYKLFWYYMLSNCDHAGFFKVNLRSFCGLLEVKIEITDILRLFNSGKQRIRIIDEHIWFIEDFIAFQYGHIFNINNPLHKGIKKQLDKYEVILSSIRGLTEVNLTTKEKEKDKEIKERIGGKGERKTNGKVLHGVKFDEKLDFVFFEDESFQEIGNEQRFMIKEGRLSPIGIIKGSKY